jgi:hypothetical protein
MFGSMNRWNRIYPFSRARARKKNIFLLIINVLLCEVESLCIPAYPFCTALWTRGDSVSLLGSFDSMGDDIQHVLRIRRNILQYEARRSRMQWLEITLLFDENCETWIFLLTWLEHSKNSFYNVPRKAVRIENIVHHGHNVYCLRCLFHIFTK